MVQSGWNFVSGNILGVATCLLNELCSEVKDQGLYFVTTRKTPDFAQIFFNKKEKAENKGCLNCLKKSLLNNSLCIFYVIVMYLLKTVWTSTGDTGIWVGQKQIW